MFARVIRSDVSSAEMVENVRLFKEVSVPTLKRQKGFRKGFFVVDRNTGKTTAVSIWDTEGDARAYEASGDFEQIISHFRQIMTSQPVVESGEVAVEF